MLMTPISFSPHQNLSPMKAEIFVYFLTTISPLPGPLLVLEKQSLNERLLNLATKFQTCISNCLLLTST